MGGLSQCLGPIDIGGFSPTPPSHLLQFQHFQDRLPSTFFSQFRIAEKGIVSETTCNLTECFSLSPGTYVVVVSEGRESVEFLLRIFLKMPNSDRYRTSGILNVFILLNFIRTHHIILCGSALCQWGTQHGPHSGETQCQVQCQDKKEGGDIA